jgi:hypothetical protein
VRFATDLNRKKKIDIQALTLNKSLNAAGQGCQVLAHATGIGYDPTREVSLLFFKTVQNKVHWAITGRTAAGIIHGRMNAAKADPGLTNW